MVRYRLSTVEICSSLDAPPVTLYRLRGSPIPTGASNWERAPSRAAAARRRKVRCAHNPLSGISRFTPLLLLSKPNPLRWASVWGTALNQCAPGRLYAHPRRGTGQARLQTGRTQDHVTWDAERQRAAAHRQVRFPPAPDFTAEPGLVHSRKWGSGGKEIENAGRFPREKRERFPHRRPLAILKVNCPEGAREGGLGHW